MRPHYKQSSHENATPSSGTSLLASYKEVPPPPGLIHVVINSSPLPTAPSPHRAIHKMIFLLIPLNCYFLSGLHSHPAFSAHLNVWNRLATKKLFHVSYPPLGNDL